ncbi:hypothetical protein TBC1_11337 [Lentimicrobium saccharophilum]|uniref:Uncharacterized protein n=2 Tax=Lentimicrobium TaxID=1840214 RepID=A0A0S7BZH7_9BACT|nr:hypothetical protein [Lentimicrobium saccharophilum]GAP42208.1 hypothetical protein TBC1_11337 [Lentimicrobium saccharophilum]
MKKLFYPLIILSLLMSFANAQKPITFNDDSQVFGNVDFPGIWVSIPEANAETVMKNWQKAIQKGTKSKVSVNGMDASLFGALIKDVYEGPVNIESRIKNQDSLVLLFAGVELRRGEFAEKGTHEYDRLKAYLKDFAKSEYLKVAEDQLAAEEKKLKEMEKELSKTRKGKAKMEKTVQSSNNTIAAENDKISSLRKQLTVSDEQIDHISSRLSETQDAEAKKSWQSEMKTAQKKKKSQLKAINSSENKIAKAKDRIRDTKNTIDLNLGSQDQMSVRINEQKMIVSQYQNKVRTIQGY